MTGSSSVMLSLAPELRRWYYAGATVEWVCPPRDAAKSAGAVGLTTADPYETVVGHYLGLSTEGDQCTERRSAAAPEFELFGPRHYVHVVGGPDTFIQVTLHQGAYVPPPRPPSPPQPGESVPVDAARVARTDGNLRDYSGATNPIGL